MVLTSMHSWKYVNSLPNHVHDLPEPSKSRYKRQDRP